ncbi:peptide-methionine (R)-S-oxide reductase MsrB [Labilithrix luteola]|nr:peptide-methionine (R)-S-oxide reductase MsrB [Labilithrix luteola]
MLARMLFLPAALTACLPIVACRADGKAKEASSTATTDGASAMSTQATPPNATPVNPPAKSLTAEELRERKAKLTPEQYRVTQRSGTEPPYRNAYVDQHAPGIYVDIVSGEPLFSSKEKFESGTGWPSFYAPLEPANIATKSDREYGMTRTEVRSKMADSHLGHVFDDGPAPTGLRYCMNSASMRFVPAERLTIEGYGQYAKLFPDVKQVEQ